MRKLSVLLAMVFMLLALAACGGQITADEIVQKMRETAANTNDLHMVVTGSLAMSNTAGSDIEVFGKPANANNQATVELWLKKPNLVRVEVRTSSEEHINGGMLLHDGQSFWAYDPNSRTAFKVDSAAVRGLTAQANIPADLQDLLENPNLEDMIDQLLAMTDYTLLGEEHVGSWDTYKIALKPKAGSPAAAALTGVQGTIWVDKVTWAIVKAEGAAPQGNASLQVETLELNSGLADSAFQFTLPQGGHVIDLTNLVPRALTIDQARQETQAAGWKLLEPGYLPKGATLVQLMGSKGLMGRASTYVLSYSGGAGTPSFWISETKGGAMGAMPGKAGGGFMGMGGMPTMPGADQSDSGAGTWTNKEVTVNGSKARLATDAEGKVRAVFWHDDKAGIDVAVGGQLDEAELLKIAEGLK